MNIGFYRVFTGFYRALYGFIRFYRVLQGLIGEICKPLTFVLKVMHVRYVECLLDSGQQQLAAEFAEIFPVPSNRT